MQFVGYKGAVMERAARVWWDEIKGLDVYSRTISFGDRQLREATGWKNVLYNIIFNKIWPIFNFNNFIFTNPLINRWPPHL